MSSSVSCCCTDTGHLVCIWGSLVKFQGVGMFKVWCVVAVGCSFLCCLPHRMQAMTHSGSNDPSQQAVKLVVAGPGFFNNVVLDCICRDQWQWKMGWIGEMALPSVTLTLKIVPQNAFVSRLMRKPSLLLPWRQTFLSNGNSRIQEFLFEVRFYFSKKLH